MQVDRQTLLFFIIMFVFLSLPGTNDQPHSTRDKDTLFKFQEGLKKAKEELSKSEYQSGYGDISGFRLSYIDNVENRNISEWPFHKYTSDQPWVEDEKYSIIPNVISDNLKAFWGKVNIEDSNEKSYLFNISGNVFGKFDKAVTKEPLKKYNFELPSYLKDYFEYYTQRRYEEDKQKYEEDPDNQLEPEKPSKNVDKIGNITVSDGGIAASIKSSDYNFQDPEMSEYVTSPSFNIDDAVIVNVDLSFFDFEEIQRHEIETTGVYFQKSGSLVSISRTAKFLGLNALPHLTLDQDYFETSKLLVGQYLNQTNIEKDTNMDGMNSFISKSQEQCELISFLQFERTAYTADELRSIDEELKNPRGIPIPKSLPKLVIKDYIIYSPDCGIFLTKKPNTDFVGLKKEVSTSRLKSFFVKLLVVVGIQTFLSLRQMSESRTPGQLSVISAKTLYIFGYQDALLSLTFLLISSLSTELYLLSACIAVVTFIMCGTLEFRFMVSVMSTQANEGGTTWWQILRGSTDNGDTDETTIHNAANASVNEESRFSNSIFAIGFSLTIVSIFILINATMWRAQYRRIFEFISLLFINSYWLPQFFRNTLKNRRKSFTWEFVLGTSIVRLWPVLYLCLDASNPLRHRKDPQLAATVSCWVFLQVFALYLQFRLGSRFWLNDRWLPKAYDYHPVLSLKDLEIGFASDILANITAHDTGDLIDCKLDCAICMNQISLPIRSSSESKSTVSSKDYMVTPCFHIFHTDCLGDWMKYKLQCPVCRNSLPPT